MCHQKSFENSPFDSYIATGGFKHGMTWSYRVKHVLRVVFWGICLFFYLFVVYLFIYLFIIFISEIHSPSLRGQKLTSMCLSSDPRETERHHSKNSPPLHALLYSMFYKMHTNA